jgi:integrase
MRTNFSIWFFIRKTNPKDLQTATLFCRIIINKEKIEFSLNRKLNPKYWSVHLSKMRGVEVSVEVINDFIDSTRSKIYQHYTELQNANTEITPEALRDRFHGKEELQHTVLSTCAHQNQMAKELMERGELSYDRYLKYTKCVEYLREYNKEKFGKEDILLRSVELQYIREFEHFLLVRKKLKGTSANTYLKLLKKMVRNAFLNNWISKEPFAAYKMKSYKTDIKYLTQEELDRIKAVDFNFERMNTVKDVFIFSCYTGVSYGDMEQLKGTDIQTNAKGESFIARKRGKTDSPYFILLTKPVLDIIEKHKEHCEQTGKLLPVTTNQKLNFYLKELATAAGIDKNLTMHMARHTFATTVALANGISMETLMMILGHTKISTTQHYGKVMNQQVINEMNMLNEKLK